MRRKKTPHHESLDRWLVSYADFITLLFAFFTTMYAISTVDAKKLGRMVLSMQAAFDDTAQGSPGHPAPGVFNTGQAEGAPSAFPAGGRSLDEAQKLQVRLRQDELARARQGNLPEVGEGLRKVVVSDALGKNVSVSNKTRGVVISLAEAGFFDSGSADIRPESYPLLDKICAVIKPLPNFVRVEGHTDNVPIQTLRFPSNWELSTARATAILAYLLNRHRLDPGRLSAVGYGEFHPVGPNATVEGRAKNRRVDIVVLNPAAMLNEPAFDTSPPDGRQAGSIP